MTLNEIFEHLNSYVGRVDSVIGSLTDPNRLYIDQRLNQAIYYSQYIADNMLRHSEDLDTAQTAAIKYLMLSYRRLVDEYDDHISQLREGVEIIFTQLYNNITFELRAAIALTWNEIQESETFLIGQMDGVERRVLETLATEITKLDTELRLAIDAITGEQDEGHDSLWEEITRAASEVYDYVTSQVTDLVNTVSAWVSELWDYVGSIMDWLTTKFNEFYVQIVDWVSDTLSSIGARITREVNTLMGSIIEYYNRAATLVSTAKGWLVSEIDRLSITLRGLLNAAIAEVQYLLDDLALLTDWRFTFFNLSLSFPELSFLQVLNRDDETFNRFKPYWQALFARVMEED